MPRGRRALAWCHEPRAPVDNSGKSFHRTDGAPSVLPTSDFLAAGTSRGSVIIFSVFADAAKVSYHRDSSTNGTNKSINNNSSRNINGSNRNETGGGKYAAPLTGGGSGGGGFGGGTGTSAVFSVRASPLRRVCPADNWPVGFLTFISVAIVGDRGQGRAAAAEAGHRDGGGGARFTTVRLNCVE